MNQIHTTQEFLAGDNQRVLKKLNSYKAKHKNLKVNF